MPAIVDHDPVGGGAPVSVFESGAILVYLAGKTGRFIPADARGRVECLEWLFWQVGGLGPMTGQYGHFHTYAPERIPYAMERYSNEAERLLDVLDRRLQDRAFIAGDDYTIADMACYPWIDPYSKAPLDLEPFAEVRRWRDAIAARPATVRAYARGKEVNPSAGQPMSDEEKKVLFGQRARRG
jgi:GST-like protein